MFAEICNVSYILTCNVSDLLTDSGVSVLSDLLTDGLQFISSSSV